MLNGSISPILVESSSAFFTQMFSPDSCQWTQAMRCFNVSHDANNHHWWSLYDSDSFNNFLFMNFYKENESVK